MDLNAMGIGAIECGDHLQKKLFALERVVIPENDFLAARVDLFEICLAQSISGHVTGGEGEEEDQRGRPAGSGNTQRKFAHATARSWL